MKTYVRCCDCKAITSEGARGWEATGPDLLTLNPYCRVCGCEQFEDVAEDVCTGCEKALAVKDDDYCEPCGDLEDEKAFDLEIMDARRIPDRDLPDTLFRIATGLREAV